MQLRELLLQLLLLLLPVLSVCTPEGGLRNRTAAGAAAVQCVRKIDACRCETASGGRIDLSPLAKSGGAFAFADRPSPSGEYRYSYNPCNAATCDGSSDAAVCQKTIGGLTREFLMGTQASATFETDPTLGLYLKYSGLSGDQQQREAHLQLVCDTSGSGESLFTPLDDGVVGTSIVYKLSLLSGHCCEEGPVDPGGGGGGLSGGDVLLIVVFSLAVLYLAGGLAVNLFVRKLSGPGALPNADFWAGLPGLVRDGAVFSYASAKAAVNRGRSGGGAYESV